MAAGDFSASNIPILKQTVVEAWESSRANNAQSLYDPSTETIKAIMANDITSAFKRYVTLDDNCLGVEIDWIEFNPTVSMDSDFINHQVVPCDITGDQGQSKAETKRLEHRLRTSFSIPETQCANLFRYADKYAQHSLESDRALIRALSAHLLNRLHGFAGANKAPDNNLNVGTIDAGNPLVTKVNPANMAWQDFYPYLGSVMSFNRMRNPFLLDGTAFNRQRFLADVQKGTMGDTGAANAFDMERYYADARTFNEAGIGAKLYYISQGAVAFASMARNPVVDGDTYPGNGGGPVLRYQEPVAGLTYPDGRPIMKDVFAKQSLVPTGNGRDCYLMRTFQYELPFELFLNPKLSTDDVTGVLEFAIDKDAPVKYPS